MPKGWPIGRISEAPMALKKHYFMHFVGRVTEINEPKDIIEKYTKDLEFNSNRYINIESDNCSFTIRVCFSDQSDLFPDKAGIECPQVGDVVEGIVSTGSVITNED